MNEYAHLLHDLIIREGATETLAVYVNMFSLLLIGLILVFAIDRFAKIVLVKLFSKFATRTKTNFDDLLVKNKVPRNLGHVFPLLIALEIIPYVFLDFPSVERIAEKGIEVFAIILALWIARSLLNTLKSYFKTLPRLKDKPIDSFIQVFMIFAWVAGFIIAIAIITDTAVWKFLTALGATSAVLILVFKDTILGFVASIQISINDMVRIGDWITFQKYGADGDVIEINLASVKVQNFDNTITTIPTYSLISDSFQNWRGMVESEGRRIKRSLIIKQDSVKFLSNNDVEKLKKIQLISAYIESRQADIEAYNLQNEIDKELAINGRNLTNIGVFRKYINSYLENHSAINENMMIMVRQMDPTPQGIPIQIYAFSSDKRWLNYEYIMSDIFDHSLAAVPFFDLELFELPNGTSFNKII
ncbi:mechanosensitive ion channel family protein [Flavobacteriales bacterium]|nr:mechanosensitive ion channel family protein [Flavobacteriales bacterium]